jgi:predicted nucleotidyltransferase component of viral defense system
MSDDATSKANHEDSRRFQDALRYTASVTGFSERLIEKDYYCSVLLKDLEALFGQGLVFKGGTCLSKVHTEFFRLSEDLDFGMSVKPDASRRDRRQVAAPIKGHLAGVAGRLPCFSEVAALTGQNNNKQYSGKLAYRSVVTGEHESIKIEVSLREEVLLPAEQLPAKTMLIDPLIDTRVLTPIVVRALSLREAYAEKTRAALTRRDPAIRDFFDIDNAVHKGLLQHSAPEFLRLVSQKLALTVDPVDTSTERIEILTRQIETQLKPVLRSADFEEFDLDRVVALLLEVVAECGRK